MTAPVLELVQDLDAVLPRLLLDSVVDYAIFVLDPRGNVASWNPGAERIKGWARQEIVGKHFSVFYPPDEIASRRPWHVLEEVEARGRLAEEGWRVRKDGTTFWADVVITALRDSEGDLIGFAKVTRDLTGRRNATEADREMARVQERERIGRDLHQGVIRTLFGIGLSLQALAIQTSEGLTRSRLETAIDELDNAITQLRSHVLGQQAATAVQGESRVAAAAARVSKKPKSRKGKATR